MIFCYFGVPRPPKHQNGGNFMEFHEIWWNLAKCWYFRDISVFWGKGAPRAEMAPKYLWKRQGILGVLASRLDRGPVSRKSSEIMEINENYDFHEITGTSINHGFYEISWNFMKIMILIDFHDFWAFPWKRDALWARRQNTKYSLSFS